MPIISSAGLDFRNLEYVVQIQPSVVCIYWQLLMKIPEQL